MFKQSRRKIVISIMSILVLLWVGSLGIIYAFSYLEMTRQNEQMLRAHAEMYTLTDQMHELQDNRPAPNGEPGFKPEFTESPMFKLSNFYTVALSYDGKVLELKNEPPTVHADNDLIALAKEIAEGDKKSGVKDNLSFYQIDKGGYELVTFMDNTIVNKNAMMLLRYTLIFGAFALVLFFFLAVYLAKKIVNPLEESYQKQKQFISDAGHELKTPVSVVSANAELLEREVGKSPWLTNIQYENERMGLLIGQLLDLARTESITPQMEQINFSRLVEGEALLFESVAYEKGISLTTNITEDIFLLGNTVQLKQLVSILLDNAISHSKEEEVWINLNANHKHVILSVLNKGDEIAPAHQEQIFERFFRIDESRNSEGNHYGLGLAIAKAIATSHNGKIGVTWEDGFVKFDVAFPNNQKI